MSISINEHTKKLLDESIAARKSLEKAPVRALRDAYSPPPGDFFSNYASALLNRQIDVFDDSIFLIDHGRVGAACAISRGMIEAYALSQFALEEVTKAFDKAPSGSKAEKALEITLKFTNSSRFKKSEQEKLKKGVFQLEDYKFTQEATHRMLNQSAYSVHVQNGLRYLYEREMDITKNKESSHELLYDALSEWVHPSQTSVWVAYAKGAQIVETSFGAITTWDAAMSYCASALHFITGTGDVYRAMLEAADEINKVAQSEKFP